MFSALAAIAIAVGSWLQVPGGTWQPDATVVAGARAQLPTYAKQQASSKGLSLRTWSSYTFQYQGRTLPKSGHRVVYVNAFCTPPPSYAAQEFVRITDGGTCYFEAYYDPASKRFIGIAFHGLA
jgi:hypothetical protein